MKKNFLCLSAIILLCMLSGIMKTAFARYGERINIFPRGTYSIKTAKEGFRGGAWPKQAPCMAAAYRDTYGNLDMGFRCARVKVAK